MQRPGLRQVTPSEVWARGGVHFLMQLHYEEQHMLYQDKWGNRSLWWTKCNTAECGPSRIIVQLQPVEANITILDTTPTGAGQPFVGGLQLAAANRGQHAHLIGCQTVSGMTLQWPVLISGSRWRPARTCRRLPDGEQHDITVASAHQRQPMEASTHMSSAARRPVSVPARTYSANS